MSGLELVGFVFGALGTLEQSIMVAKLLRNNFKDFGENEAVGEQLLKSLIALQHDLNQLESQLEQYQSSIPETNHKMIKNQLIQMKGLFEKVHVSVSEMNRSAGRNFKTFMKASKCAEKCLGFQQDLKDAQNTLCQINFFLGNNAIIVSTKNSILQQIHIQGTSAPNVGAIDCFRPYQQKLPYSVEARPAFQSMASDGKPLSVEGNLKHKLLERCVHHKKIFAIQGPSGVGKTTTLYMLSHDQTLLNFFNDGVYYIKLGAEASVETVVRQLAAIVQKSGGIQKASEIRNGKILENAI